MSNIDNYIKRYRPSENTEMYIELFQYTNYNEYKELVEEFLKDYVIETEETGDILDNIIWLSIYKNKSKRIDECIRVKPGDYIIKYYNGEIGSCTENIGEFLLDYFSSQWY